MVVTLAAGVPSWSRLTLCLSPPRSIVSLALSTNAALPFPMGDRYEAACMAKLDNIRLLQRLIRVVLMRLSDHDSIFVKDVIIVVKSVKDLVSFFW